MQKNYKIITMQIKNTAHDQLTHLINITNSLTAQDQRRMTDLITASLDSLIQKTIKRVELYDNQIKKYKEEIKHKQNVLKMPINIPNKTFKNKYHHLEFLKLEIMKLDIQINRRRLECKYQIEYNDRFIKCLGKSSESVYSDGTEKQDLDFLRKTGCALKNEFDRKESQRQDILKEIKVFLTNLKDIFENKFDNFDIEDQSEVLQKIKNKISKIPSVEYLKSKEFRKSHIHIIEKTKSSLHRISELKSTITAHLANKITSLTTILQKDCIITENVYELQETLKKLEKENEENFKKTFNKSLIEYNELLTLFNEEPMMNLLSLNSIELKFNEQNFSTLKEIREKINTMTPRKTLFLSILEKIEAREVLCQKIVEFEKRSSDPKRLKGSSLILFKEEAFRKKTIPKLFNLEAELIDALVEYEGLFGPYLHMGRAYRERLKKEINGRVIKK